jgi:transcriptional regulator with XRE-family HTH domain
LAKSIHSARYKVLKKLLKAVRRERRLTQIELAARLGVTQSTISKVELGERRLDVIELWAWCEALGVGLNRFVARLEGEKTGPES